jgi:hypothetical protein
VALGAWLWAVPSGASEAPEPPGDASPEQDAATRAARRHFQSGVKLYRDTNYSGALAEFEAAYRDKPGPGSLQNVALSLKALFRYAEASETLKLLLERHHTELAEREQAAVRAAIDELEALIGTLKLSVAPETANVSVNGREIGVEERQRGIKLNVGEHVIIAEAPGYARYSRIVRIAGQQAVRAEVSLQATSGFLQVTTRDPQAAIAVDGEPRGYQSWFGPVSPDTEHLVQVYRNGFEPFERSIRVTAGQTVRVEGALGEQISDAPRRTLPVKPEAPPPPRAATGFYGLAALGVLGMSDAPLDLSVDQARGGSLSTFGLRAGYRLSEPIAVEAAVDVGRLAGEGACQAGTQAQGECYVKRDFTLTSIRFGPNLRLFTRGETLRFALGVGAGAVAHRIKLEPASTPDQDRLQGGSAAGVDPYFSFELGGAFNYRHLLAELSLMAFVEGADNLAGPFDEQEEQGVFSDGTLPLLGIGLKLGYSAWAPRR